MPRIYDELTPEQAIQGGYFQPKESWNRLSNNNYVHTLRKDKITKETKVLYFPGSFGTFHEGHKAVVNSALSNFSLSKGDDYMIVISPANADYLVEKYGANCEFAMNTPRFNSMKDLVTEDNNYVIDMNPMLNHRCDQNFTDLLDDYLNQYGLGIDEMTHKPVILCGKDRTDFINLNKYTDKIFVFSGGTKFDTTGQTFSTSKIEKVYRDKKNLVLRVNTDAEFNLFVDYFGEYETEKLIIPAYFIECSKYWRFMKYHQGGEHYPHYDSDFAVKGNLGHYTMYSVIIYFTDCQTGELAFMNDSRGNDTTDWDEQATADEIYLKIKPKRWTHCFVPTQFVP